MKSCRLFVFLIIVMMLLSAPTTIQVPLEKATEVPSASGTETNGTDVIESTVAPSTGNVTTEDAMDRIAAGNESQLADSETEVRTYRACVYGGNYYGHGDLINVSEPCLNCSCNHGLLACYRRACHPSDVILEPGCSLERVPGICCLQSVCDKIPSNGTLSNVIDVDDTSNSTTDNMAEETENISQEKNTSDRRQSRDRQPENFDEKLDIPILKQLDIKNFLPQRLPKNSCFHGGSIYSEGSAMATESKCKSCFCLAGRRHCMESKCELNIKGCIPQYHISEYENTLSTCCPYSYNCTGQDSDVTTTTTHSPVVSSCTVSNVTHALGDRILVEDPCQICYCMKYGMDCDIIRCEKPNSSMECEEIRENGECCPVAYKCIKDGGVETTSEIKYQQDTNGSDNADRIRFKAHANRTSEKPEYSHDPDYVPIKNGELNDTVIEMLLERVFGLANPNETSVSNETSNDSTTETNIADAYRVDSSTTTLKSDFETSEDRVDDSEPPYDVYIEGIEALFSGQGNGDQKKETLKRPFSGNGSIGRNPIPDIDKPPNFDETQASIGGIPESSSGPSLEISSQSSSNESEPIRINGTSHLNEELNSIRTEFKTVPGSNPDMSVIDTSPAHDGEGKDIENEPVRANESESTTTDATEENLDVIGQNNSSKGIKPAFLDISLYEKIKSEVGGGKSPESSKEETNKTDDDGVNPFQPQFFNKTSSTDLHRGPDKTFLHDKVEKVTNSVRENDRVINIMDVEKVLEQQFNLRKIPPLKLSTSHLSEGYPVFKKHISNVMANDPPTKLRAPPTLSPDLVTSLLAMFRRSQDSRTNFHPNDKSVSKWNYGSQYVPHRERYRGRINHPNGQSPPPANHGPLRKRGRLEDSAGERRQPATMANLEFIPFVVSDAVGLASLPRKNETTPSTTTQAPETTTEGIPCNINGTVYATRDFVPTRDPCDECACFHGNVMCRKKVCSPPPPNCRSSLMEGECCPMYTCGEGLIQIVNTENYNANENANSTESPKETSQDASGSEHVMTVLNQDSVFQVIQPGKVEQTKSRPSLNGSSTESEDEASETNGTTGIDRKDLQQRGETDEDGSYVASVDVVPISTVEKSKTVPSDDVQTSPQGSYNLGSVIRFGVDDDQEIVEDGGILTSTSDFDPFAALSDLFVPEDEDVKGQKNDQHEGQHDGNAGDRKWSQKMPASMSMEISESNNNFEQQQKHAERTPGGRTKVPTVRYPSKGTTTTKELLRTETYTKEIRTRPPTTKRIRTRPSTTTTRPTTTRATTTRATRPPQTFRPNEIKKFNDPWGLLKVSGCNIRGKTYMIGAEITELGNGCKRCTCSDMGVVCQGLDC